MAGEPAADRGLRELADSVRRRGYEAHIERARAAYESARRDDEAHRLRARADSHRARATRLTAYAVRAKRDGENLRAFYLGAAAERQSLAAQAAELDAQRVLAGELAPIRVDIEPPDLWQRLNDDAGRLAAGAVETDDRSALTGDDHPPSIEHSRRYGERGGLRVPLAIHQTDLERAMPIGPDGRVVRQADPRDGGWFEVANDGRAEADPARSVNCIDCTLAFFETWMHGRPRVSAPRTFDAYAAGDPKLVLDGEADGPGRIEDVTGGRFQELCPPLHDLAAADAKEQIDRAYAALEARLLAGGPGSMAFVINDWEGMGSHAWVVVNQGGTILYLDPQNGHISESAPLYNHYGATYDGNVIALDVLVLDGRARPMPIAGLPVSGYSVRPPLPTTPADPGPLAAAAPDAGPAETGAGPAPYVNRVHVLDGVRAALAPTTERRRGSDG